MSRAHAGAARAGAELSRGAGTLLPAVRSGHWCPSSPPRQPGSGGAAAVECLNHPRPTPEPPSLDRGYGPAGRLRWPWAFHPAGGGGAGWRGARTASAPFVASEQLSFCKTAASKQRLRQFYSANDDVRRPRGPRRPYAHPSSPTIYTGRARKRASFIFCSHPPTLFVGCCSSSGAAVKRYSQQRHLGGIGAPAAAEQPLAIAGAVCRARTRVRRARKLS